MVVGNLSEMGIGNILHCFGVCGLHCIVTLIMIIKTCGMIESMGFGRLKT